jgi:chaperone modulatory protein CbpM
MTMNGDADFRLDVDALSRSCRCSVELIVELVHEGAIEPQGAAQHDWRFDSFALRRARRAVRLAHDLELNAPGVALALDLLDEIARLEATLAARR